MCATGWVACLQEILPHGCGELLDLGCGTGLELDCIFQKIPKIKVTGIDLCNAMLDVLKKKHSGKDLNLICGDYFTENFGENKYDAAVSAESFHHFKPEKKQRLFKKIYDSLKKGGIYIECDYIACCEEEETLLFDECRRIREKFGVSNDVFIHFDTPLTLEHEMSLINKAGFAETKAVESINGAVIITALRK